ncbi:MAG: HrpJ domain-containing protein [Pseudomonadota bacterium]|nr:HrpJ domain-containing protein [Pseudomonadota bacterium]
MVREIRNRQIVGAGHTHETKSAKERAATVNAVTQPGSVAFFEENKEEFAQSIARVKSARLTKKKTKKKVEVEDETTSFIKKTPDINKAGLKPFVSSLMADDKPLREQDIAAQLKRNGFTDPSHIYLALKNATQTIAKDLNKFAFSPNIQARELYMNRIQSLNMYIQNHMEKHGEEVLATLNAGEEQDEFSKKGLGTPQVLRDYYRSTIKEPKSVLAMYKDIIGRKGGIPNFKTYCDFLMKFISRHLECVQGKYQFDSVKLELMHTNIHLLRSVQSELERVHQYFGQYTSAKGAELDKFKHKVFEQVATMVESVSVREAQVDGLNSLCKVTDPKKKIGVVNNLIACVTSMPEPLFPNTTAKIKIRMMIYNVSEKLMKKAGETPEEFAKDQLYYKADGFKANAADPALEPLKVAAYFPGEDAADTGESQAVRDAFTPAAKKDTVEVDPQKLAETKKQVHKHILNKFVKSQSFRSPNKVPNMQTGHALAEVDAPEPFKPSQQVSV